MKPILKALFVRRLTKDLTDGEQSLIEESSLPDLEPISPEILSDLQAHARATRKTLLQAMGIFLVVMLLALLIKAYIYAMAIGCTLLMILLAILIGKLNASVDDTAVVMQIAVHHTEERRFWNDAVCYLPDGKYLLHYSKHSPTPNTVTAIEFDRHTQCLLRRKDETI